MTKHEDFVDELDSLIDAVWNEACDMMQDGGTADIQRGIAKKRILTKLNEVEREAYERGWVNAHKAVMKKADQVVKYYKQSTLKQPEKNSDD